MNKQIEEFKYLWHELLQIDHSTEIEHKYPNLSKLTVNEISVIEIVAKRPHVILKDICTALRLPKSTLTNVINTLDRKGYLFRTIVKQDYRTYGLELTEKGLQTQQEHLDYEEEVCSNFLNPLDEQEREQFIQTLNKILDAYNTKK